MRIQVERARRADDGDDAVGRAETALDVQRHPRIRRFVFGAAESEFSGLAVGSAVHFAGQRTADILQHEAQRTAERRIRAAALPQAVEARVHTQRSRERSVDDDPRRRRIGRGLDALQIECGIGDRFDRGQQHRQIFGPATRHHRVDRDPFDRCRAESRRNMRDDFIARAPGGCKHCVDALQGRWNERQPVAPMALLAFFVERSQVVRHHYNCGARIHFVRAAAFCDRRLIASTHCQPRHFIDERLRECAHFGARAHAERMRHHRNRQVGAAQRLQLRTSKRHERSRAHDQRGVSLVCRLHAVVDTPRRAAPSVAGAGDDEVALFLDVGEHFL